MSFSSFRPPQRFSSRKRHRMTCQSGLPQLLSVQNIWAVEVPSGLPPTLPPKRRCQRRRFGEDPSKVRVGDHASRKGILSHFRYSCVVTKTSLDPGSFFNGVPGPTPWYPTPGDLAVEGFHWERSSGRTLLVGNAGVVAVLNYYNYVMRPDSSTLLIWNQRNESDYQGAPPVRLVVIQPGCSLPSGTIWRERFRK